LPHLLLQYFRLLSAIAFNRAIPAILTTLVLESCFGVSSQPIKSIETKQQHINDAPEHVHDVRAPIQAAYYGVKKADTLNLRQKNPSSHENAVVRDNRVEQVAKQLCKHIGHPYPPNPEIVRFLSHAAGMVLPTPIIAFGPDLLSDSTSQKTNRYQSSRPFMIKRDYLLFGQFFCTNINRDIFLWFKKSIDLKPVRRKMILNESTLIQVRSRRINSGKIRVVYATPRKSLMNRRNQTQRQDQTTREDIIESKMNKVKRGWVSTIIDCNVPGTYWVDILLQKGKDLQLAANFPIYCATMPEKSIRASTQWTPIVNLNRVEDILFQRLNQFRKERGLDVLKYSKVLRDIARNHSNDMYRNYFVGHHSHETGDASDRLKKYGIPYTTVRENVARAYTISAALRDLEHSPAHLKNMLSEDVDYHAVGVALDETVFPPTMLITQLYAEDERSRASRQQARSPRYRTIKIQ